MPERFPVQVDADQFDRLARPTQPVAGVAELIWNALDAEADVVSVTIDRAELDAVDAVTVTDDGHGMTHDDALRDFRRWGGSWKKLRTLSRNGHRTLHGKEGGGRFRAFAIGSTVEWSSVSRRIDGVLERTRVTGSMDSSEFVVGDPEVLATGEQGTQVRISRPREHANRMLGEGAVPWLVTRFAVNLLKYPGINITYDGTVLDPATIIERETEVSLDPALGGKHGAPVLRLLEWKAEAHKAITPSLLLCDQNGIGLHEITGQIEKHPGIAYTGYLTWSRFGELAQELLLAELGHATIGPIVDAAREVIRNYLDERLSERRAEVLARWKADRVYPYKGAAMSPAEAQERKVFDVVAVAAAPVVPKDTKGARVSLKLIKTALAQPPGALHRVLKEVLELTAEQLADFDRLLDRTSLATVIYASKLVTDRLDFLHDLEAMLFDEGKRERLLERQQLHRILANGNTWVFGEQFALVAEEKGLKKVLQAHRHLLGQPHDDSSVTDIDGRPRRLDLMLSKVARLPDKRQHLVVELKRPSLKLTQSELNQIANYAVTVSRDERFKSPDVSWEFWLVGDLMDDIVQEMANQKDSPRGLYMQGETYRIWVRRWAEVLEENRQRLHFYRERLSYVEPQEEAQLDEVVSKYLPPTPESAEPARAAAQ